MFEYDAATLLAMKVGKALIKAIDACGAPNSFTFLQLVGADDAPAAETAVRKMWGAFILNVDAQRPGTRVWLGDGSHSLDLYVAYAPDARVEEEKKESKVHRVPAAKLAAGYVAFLVGDRSVTMTTKGWELLRSVGTGIYVSGPQIRITRGLEDGGLATVRDDGNLKIQGRVDGERFFVELTALGKTIVDAPLTRPEQS